jgi:hypothetical protein
VAMLLSDLIEQISQSVVDVHFAGKMDTETAVARLTANGLNEQQIAERLPHILIVTAVHPDENDPERTELEYTVECPGVTDACRRYEDCRASLAEQDLLYRSEDRIAHGQRHISIDSCWMAETPFCNVMTNDWLQDSADGRFPLGRHPITWDVGDGTEMFVLPLTDVELPTRRTAPEDQDDAAS